MQAVINGVKKIDLPLNMISSLGNAKTAKVSDNILNGLKNYYQETAKLEKQEYRDRVSQLYDNLNGIKPIDSTINNVIYLKNYLEKGVAIKANLNSLKQVWIEYRLIYNEQVKKKEVEIMPEDFKITDSYVLDNFDEIFDRLTMKVDGVSKYIQDLKDMQAKVNASNESIEEEKEKLHQEKLEFEEYKIIESRKIEEDRADLQKQIKRLEELVNVFDLKMSDLIS